MIITIALILLASVAVATLELWLFWRLDAREVERTSRRRRRWNSDSRDSDPAADDQTTVVSRVGGMF